MIRFVLPVVSFFFIVSKVSIVSIVLFAAFLSAPARADYCAESKLIDESFDTSAVSQVALSALAGELDIRAGTGNTVTYSGRACTSEPEYLEMMGLASDQQGDTLYLETIIPHNHPDFDPSYASIDITLTVPASLRLSLKDSSGDIESTGVSITSIEDSSGEIRVVRNLSDISITDSSGAIEVTRVEGNVKVQDSSGEIEIQDVTGNVTIPADSSGDISIENVRGAVDIRQDSSGSIDVDTALSVTVGADGSGDIDISNIAGDVFVGADGSGDISVHDIEGDFTVSNKGSGDIRSTGIAGALSIPR